MKAWLDAEFIPTPVRRHAVNHPQLLLNDLPNPPEESGWNAPLNRPPEFARDLAPQVGYLGSLGDPSGVAIVTGICQGKNLEEKNNWKEHNPTLETVFQLDVAARLARRLKADLIIWIVDQEYVNVANADGEDAALEVDLGKRCRTFISGRYPTATIEQTSDPAVRGRLYTRLTEMDVSHLYARGVTRPYGISHPSLWDFLDYLSCVGSFLCAAIDHRAVVGVVDHDQLRALRAARRLAGEKVSGMILWPVPHLGWRPPIPTSDFSVHFDAIKGRSSKKDSPRRMHACKDHAAKVHIGYTEEQLGSAQLRKLLDSGQLCEQAVREIICYAHPEALAQLDKGLPVESLSASLVAAIAHMRENPPE